MSVPGHRLRGPESQLATLSNKRVETNRRPALPLEALHAFESVPCAPPCLPAAVAHPCRST
jgi:hypothetical protein